MRISSIDGLRTIMIMFIVLLHSCRFGVSWGSGTYANLFFFAISGYLLFGRRAQGGLHTFLFNRLKKIYPAYILSTGVLILFGYFKGFFNLLLNITLTSSGWFYDDETLNGPAWFLCVLLLAYIVFYIISRFIDIRYQPYVILVLMIAFYLTGIAGLSIPFLYSRTMIGISEFMAGCLLRCLTDIISPDKRYTVALILGAVFAAVLILRFGFSVSIGNTIILYGLILIPLMIFISVNGKVITGILSVKPLAYLGQKSLYLFVWHRPLLSVFNRVIKNENTWISDIRFELAYVVFVIAFCLVYGLIESRAITFLLRTIRSEKHELS